MCVEYKRDHLFSLTDNAEHDRRRKLGFDGTGSSKFEISVYRCLGDSLNPIRSKFLSSNTKVVPVDMATKVQYFTHDTISTTTFSRAFGMIQNDTDANNYIQPTKEGFSMGNIALALGLVKLTQLPLIGEMLSPSPKDETGYGKMLAECVSMIESRATNRVDSQDGMLGSFIRHGLSGGELRSEILDAVVIGSFAPCHAICVAILLITTNSHVHSKLCREIDNAVRDGKALPINGIKWLVTA
ncbi:hypothetical protein QQS21_005166 [Conoideocrella luteorostrata]|uniref:Uncharacterized protein n=1 Tax=Conoideocrella luteorostrata TaxID=1105319 RepID=A0AAJ0CSE2_9HYPO|nr:hypothetical protein QQS21_005166 [Conoideocrella luteorostrata]